MKYVTKSKKYLEDKCKVKYIDGKFYQDKPHAGMKELKPFTIMKNHKYGKTVTYEYIVPYNYEKHKPTIMSYHSFLYAWHNGEVPKGYDVDHIDGDTLNNSLENLQILPHTENIRKRSKGANQYGQAKPIYCVETGIEYPSIYRASREVGIKEHNIRASLNGKDPRKITLHFRYKDEIKH